MIQKEVIRDEKGIVIENREMMCRAVIELAKKGTSLEIVTSALSLVEVSRPSPDAKTSAADNLSAFFENDYVILANLDRFSGERGRELMRAGFSKLKPPDAAHVATAAVSNVDEMHTFDDKILAMDGQVERADGTKLKICKPDVGPPLPLLQPVDDLLNEASPAQDQEATDQPEPADHTAELELASAIESDEFEAETKIASDGEDDHPAVEANEVDEDLSMPARKKEALSDDERARRIQELADEAGASNDPEAFDRAFEKVVMPEEGLRRGLSEKPKAI